MHDVIIVAIGLVLGLLAFAVNVWVYRRG